MLYPYKPSVLFVRHRQTVQTQIRRRRTQRLIRVFTVCLQNILLKLWIKNGKNPTEQPLIYKTELDWSNWYEWEISFGLNGLITWNLETHICYAYAYQTSTTQNNSSLRCVCAERVFNVGESVCMPFFTSNIQVILHICVVWSAPLRTVHILIHHYPAKQTDFVTSGRVSWPIFFDFSLTVKAAPHECLVRTGQP